MSELVSEEEAMGKVAELYAGIKEDFSMAPNFFKEQAAIDAYWLELNWQKVKRSMLAAGGAGPRNGRTYRLRDI